MVNHGANLAFCTDLVADPAYGVPSHETGPPRPDLAVQFLELLRSEFDPVADHRFCQSMLFQVFGRFGLPVSQSIPPLYEREHCISIIALIYKKGTYKKQKIMSRMLREEMVFKKTRCLMNFFTEFVHEHKKSDRNLYVNGGFCFKSAPDYFIYTSRP
jgi:hypothetical protein